MSAAGRTLEIFRDAAALLEDDHFVYVNGDHGSGWIAKDRVIPNPAVLDELGALLARAIMGLQPEVLCGPAVGGLIIAQWTARHLGIPAVFTEHDTSVPPGTKGRPPFCVKRGFEEWLAGKRVVVVDDIVSTGFSVRQTLAAVRAAGGKLAGVGTLISRGNVDAAGLGGGAFVFLAEVKIPSWPEAECPPEILARPVNTKYAHGAEYLAARRGG